MPHRSKPKNKNTSCHLKLGVFYYLRKYLTNLYFTNSYLRRKKIKKHSCISALHVMKEEIKCFPQHFSNNNKLLCCLVSSINDKYYSLFSATKTDTIQIAE